MNLPPELRAIIFEVLSWDTIVAIVRALPGLISELVGEVTTIEFDYINQVIPYTSVRSFSHARIIKPTVFVDQIIDHPVYREVHFHTSTLEPGNEIIKCFGRPDQRIRVSCDGYGFIEWNRGTLIMGPEVCDGRSLELGKDLTFDNLIVTDSTLNRNIIGRLFVMFLKCGLRTIEYVFDRPVEYSKIADDIDSNFLTTGREPHPTIEELIFPLLPDTIFDLIHLCPNLKRIGFYLDGTENNLLRFLTQYPTLTVVIFSSQPVNSRLLEHPRVEIRA